MAATLSTKTPQRGQGKTPELERRNCDDFMHYLEHGYPSPLVRWHCHEEYELHLIVATSGKLFVGDYIGEFAHAPLELAAQSMPELREVLPLLSHATYGIEFIGMARFFRKATGNSFTDFVNRIRINKACQLLMNTDQYVTNVCYNVGFNNVANFNRRFLQLKGITPKEFRRKAEGRFGGEPQTSEEQ